MKIAFISTMHGSAWGGSEYLWVAAAAQALEEGHKIILSIYDWSTNHPLITKLQYQGAQLLSRPRFPKPPSLTSRIARKLFQYLPLKARFFQSSYQPVFDCKPDVIYISQGSSYDVACIVPDLLSLLQANSIPYVIVCQFNSDTFYLDESTREAAKKYYNKATHIVFVSNHNLRIAERQLAQSLPNAVVVQNPVNLHDISILPYPFESTIYFGVVARLETVCKGQDMLFEVLSSPIWKEQEWQCNLYGSGPDKAYLEALAQHYGIAHRVNLKDHVSDVRSIWSENHLLVLPSRAEGTPLSLIEAMLCGRPAVVTDVGGNAEWIEESNTGFIAEAPTAKSFGAALQRAWLARDNWKQMGINAHEYAFVKLDRSPGKSLLKLALTAKNC